LCNSIGKKALVKGEKGGISFKKKGSFVYLFWIDFNIIIEINWRIMICFFTWKWQTLWSKIMPPTERRIRLQRYHVEGKYLLSFSTINTTTTTIKRSSKTKFKIYFWLLRSIFLWENFIDKCKRLIVWKCYCDFLLGFCKINFDSKLLLVTAHDCFAVFLLIIVYRLSTWLRKKRERK